MTTGKGESSEALLHNAKILLQQGQLDKAVIELQQLLESKPEYTEALYYLAVCQRKQQSLDAAQSTLQVLLDIAPDYARAYQEQGYNHKALGQVPIAKKAFEQAVTLNPALLASWKMLLMYFSQEGNAAEISTAQQHITLLSGLPAELLTVTSLIYENKLYKAEQICRRFLQANPRHVEAMRLLAELGIHLNILDDAEFLLESCLQFEPDYQRARLDYVKVLHKRQKFKKALEEAQILHRYDSDNVGFEITLANQYQAMGHFETALDIYQRILKKNPTFHGIHMAHGHALKTVGRTDAAIQAYRASYQAKPDFGDAFWSLANLKTYRFTDEELAHMRDYEANLATASVDRIHLCFAIGKALEDQQEYADAFDYYKRGNQLKKAEGRYRSEQLVTELNMQKQQFNADFFQQRLNFGFASTAPIFIVGLPRAGSTLLEQILASHSQVDGTMELTNIVSFAHRLNGRRAAKQTAQYPAVLNELSAEQFLAFGEAYIKDTQYHRQGGVYFIDKMPNNFRHIALIQLMLPNAKIIDARRHPMACCFSGFKQLFADGQEFTYGLEDIGTYYRQYVDIMNHWDAELPGKVLRVQHEDVVADLETQVRRILDFCDLPFEQQCIDFHKTERAIRTPSSEQVRQPIYKTGLEQWQHFEAFLDPLKEALGPALQYY